LEPQFLAWNLFNLKKAKIQTENKNEMIDANFDSGNFFLWKWKQWRFLQTLVCCSSKTKNPENFKFLWILMTIGKKSEHFYWICDQFVKCLSFENSVFVMDFIQYVSDEVLVFNLSLNKIPKQKQFKMMWKKLIRKYFTATSLFKL
jgi:hypothetical protein